MSITDDLSTSGPDARADLSQDPRFSALPPDIQARLKKLSPEAAAAVIASGLIFWVVPGPGTPLILAGGLRLWPNLFHKVANKFQEYFPKGHATGLDVLRRFLDDMESRFHDSRSEQPKIREDSNAQT